MSGDDACLAVRSVYVLRASGQMERGQRFLIVREPTRDQRAVDVVQRARIGGEAHEILPDLRKLGALPARLRSQPVGHAVLSAGQPDGLEMVDAALCQRHQRIDFLGFHWDELQQAIDIAVHQTGLLALQNLAERVKGLALCAQTRHEARMVAHHCLCVRRCSRTAARSLSATTPESTRKRPSLIACLTSSTRAASTTATLLSASSTRCSKLDPSLSSTLSPREDETAPCGAGC